MTVSYTHLDVYKRQTEIGKKWQIDVKYVPKECKTEGMTKDIKYYQYTCIDVYKRQVLDLLQSIMNQDFVKLYGIIQLLVQANIIQQKMVNVT